MFIVHIIDYYDQRSVALIQNELLTKVDCLYIQGWMGKIKASVQGGFKK